MGDIPSTDRPLMTCNGSLRTEHFRGRLIGYRKIASWSALKTLGSSGGRVNGAKDRTALRAHAWGLAPTELETLARSI